MTLQRDQLGTTAFEREVISEGPLLSFVPSHICFILYNELYFKVINSCHND